MKEKVNDPTPQRPGAVHLLDAPVIEIDLARFSLQLKTEEAWKTSDRNAVTLCKTAGLRVVMMALHAGAEMTEHSANGTLSLQVLEGQINFITKGKTHSLTQGQMLCLHPQIPHAVTAAQESVLLLTLTGPQDASLPGA